MRNPDLKKNISSWERSLVWKGFLTHKVEEIVALVKVSLLYVRVPNQMCCDFSYQNVQSASFIGESMA